MPFLTRCWKPQIAVCLVKSNNTAQIQLLSIIQQGQVSLMLLLTRASEWEIDKTVGTFTQWKERVYFHAFIWNLISCGHFIDLKDPVTVLLPHSFRGWAWARDTVYVKCLYKFFQCLKRFPTGSLVLSYLPKHASRLTDPKFYMVWKSLWMCVCKWCLAIPPRPYSCPSPSVLGIGFRSTMTLP